MTSYQFALFTAFRRFRRNYRMQKLIHLFWILPTLAGIPARAAEPKPETIAAFDRYIAAIEARMDDDLRTNKFLFVDRLPASERQEAYDQLRDGQVYIQEVRALENQGRIRIPNGVVHHWVGVIFIPDATLSETIAVLQDYDHQPEIYNPDVRKSKLIEQNGEKSKIFEQYFNKSIITVVLNVEFDVSDTQFGNTRHQTAARSTRIAEVANPGTPGEHDRSPDESYGYMWRLNSYWRFEEKNGGVYVEDETIELSRTVPAIFAWIVNPLTKSIPRDILNRDMADARTAVTKAATVSKHAGAPQ
jgi:hypothetical protein